MITFPFCLPFFVARTPLGESSNNLSSCSTRSRATRSALGRTGTAVGRLCRTIRREIPPPPPHPPLPLPSLPLHYVVGCVALRMGRRVCVVCWMLLPFTLDGNVKAVGVCICYSMTTETVLIFCVQSDKVLSLFVLLLTWYVLSLACFRSSVVICHLVMCGHFVAVLSRNYVSSSFICCRFVTCWLAMISCHASNFALVFSLFSSFFLRAGRGEAVTMSVETSLAELMARCFRLSILQGVYCSTFSHGVSGECM